MNPDREHSTGILANPSGLLSHYGRSETGLLNNTTSDMDTRIHTEGWPIR